MREGSHAERAAPGEYLGVALQRDPKESEQRPHLALVHCEGDVERRSLLASTKRETILASLGVTPGGSR